MIEELLEGAEKTFMLPKKPGFRDKGFILGAQMFGTARGLYRQPDRADKPTLGLSSGSVASWVREVAAPLESSSFGSVALMAALAAPLISYVEIHNRINRKGSPLLAESMTLNFSGTSGSGKTLVSSIAASTFGPSDSMAKWDFSRAGFERLCEESNDVLLNLDDTEKHVESEIKLKTAIAMVNQYVPGRKSKALSRIGHDGASPPREWSTIGLSSSPKPIDTLTTEGGWQRSFGEKVRLINISVPCLENRGHIRQLAEKCCVRSGGSASGSSDYRGHDT